MGGGQTETASPSAWQGLFEHLESGEGGGTLSPDLRSRNALSVLMGDQSDRFDIGKSAEDP